MSAYDIAAEETSITQENKWQRTLHNAVGEHIHTRTQLCGEGMGLTALNTG